MSSYSPAAVHVTDMAGQAIQSHTAAAARPTTSSLAHWGERVALGDGGKAALRTEHELADVGVLGGALDLADERLAGLDLAVLGRHQAEDGDRPLRQVAQRGGRTRRR